jgi:small subunit ribosomal protein S8
MSQDIVSDGLNQIMNAVRLEKENLTITRYSGVLIHLLEIMKQKGHITYVVDELSRKVTVDILKLNICKAVKPRYSACVGDIDKYLRRFLPSRNFGTLIISTNKGLLDHKEAKAQKIGGSVIAYFY